MQTTGYGAIIMEAMRESWTDDRLDDLRDSVGEFRAETRAEFASVRTEMREEFAAVQEEFKAVRREMATEFTALRQEMKNGFDRMQRLMIQFMGLVVVSLIGFIATGT